MTPHEPAIFAWYSRTAARRVGYQVYRKSHNGPEIHLTALTTQAARFKDFGDEVFVGVVDPHGFVRFVSAAEGPA